MPSYKKMFAFPPTLIFRHRKENLKKCSLRGLEDREDLQFWTYPLKELPPVEGYLLLALNAPPLTREDKSRGLLLLDGTWRYAAKMQERLALPLELRSLPAGCVTAYPRRQEDCQDPLRGLASVEALFVAYSVLGRETAGLLDGYYWKELFLEKNARYFQQVPS